MKKLAVLMLASLLLTAFSVNAAETNQRKHTLSGVKKVRVIEPVEKPVMRLPIPADTFRA